MIGGSKKGTSFLCQNVVNKDRKKQFAGRCCSKKNVKKKGKKFREKHFSYPRPLQENNGPSLMASVC